MHENKRICILYAHTHTYAALEGHSLCSSTFQLAKVAHTLNLIALTLSQMTFLHSIPAGNQSKVKEQPQQQHQHTHAAQIVDWKFMPHKPHIQSIV